MAIVPKTVNELLDQITSSLTDSFAVSSDTGTGTVLGALVRSFTVPLAELWADLAEVERDSNLATATGDSLDLLVNSFGMSRVVGSYATGFVVAKPKAVSNVGLLVEGSSLLYGNLVLTVGADTVLQAPYSIIPVTAGTLGVDFNLPANTVVISANPALNTQFSFAIGSALDGSNTPVGGLIGGQDPELDGELRERFALYLQSLTRATYQAVLQALQGIPELRSVAVLDSTPMPGFISIYVDDNSAATTVSDDLKAIIEQTLSEWKAVGIGVRLYMLDKVVQPVVINVTVDSNSIPASVQQAVRQAVIALLNNYGQGQSLYVSKLVDVAFNTAGVVDVKVVSPAQDVPVDSYQAFRASTVTVNVTI